MSYRCIGVALLMLLLGIGIWFGLPPLQRTFAPHVTIAELRASPDRYRNRLIKIQGELKVFSNTICGNVGTIGILLADTPEQLSLSLPINATARESTTPKAIPVIILGRGEEMNSLYSVVDKEHLSVTFWGRLRVRESEPIPCPDTPAQDIPGEKALFLDGERIHLSNGDVLLP